MSSGTPEVTLYVTDLKLSARFYANALGFTFDGYQTADGQSAETLEASDEFTSATLHTAGLIVNLVSARAAGMQAGAAAEHAIPVDDVAALHVHAKEHGANPTALVDQPWGRREFSALDADGHAWTVFAPLDSPHDQASARQRGEITGYVSIEEFSKAAQEQGLTLPQYLDKHWGTDKATLSDFSEGVFAEVARHGVFEQPIRRVVEIGTGVGMHVGTVLRRCQPDVYESYEPERGWAEWLAREYGIVSHDCDGVSLRQTATASVDLVHAHGVFVVLLFLTMVQYFREMARVLRPGGYAVFDIISVECMTDAALEVWLKSDWRWPVVLDKALVKRIIEPLGFTCVGDFLISAYDEEGVCKSNYLIFQRRATDETRMKHG